MMKGTRRTVATIAGIASGTRRAARRRRLRVARIRPTPPRPRRDGDHARREVLTRRACRTARRLEPPPQVRERPLPAGRQAAPDLLLRRRGAAALNVAPRRDAPLVTSADDVAVVHALEAERHDRHDLGRDRLAADVEVDAEIVGRTGDIRGAL